MNDKTAKVAYVKSQPQSRRHSCMEEKHAAVMLAMPIATIRKIVADLDKVGLQLGPDAREFYGHLKEGLAEYDASGSHISAYPVDVDS